MIWAFIRTAIFGPVEDRSEQAEADYLAAKERYDDAVARRDTRGQNAALKALNVALNEMLRAHSDAKRVSVPSRGVAA
jgi:hypothetical protein